MMTITLDGARGEAPIVIRMELDEAELLKRPASFLLECYFEPVVERIRTELRYRLTGEVA